MKPLGTNSIAVCSQLSWQTEAVNLLTPYPLSAPNSEKYGAGFSTAIHSALTRRAAVKSPMSSFGASFPRVHPLTTYSKATFCVWWATLTPIRERSWITSPHTGCSASCTVKPFCRPSAFRRSPQTILTWHPAYLRSKKQAAAIRNISAFRGGSYLCKFCKNTSTSVWHAHFYDGCPAHIYANTPVGNIQFPL